MKPIDDNLQDDDRRFDLLVDDELSDEQRRELLSALDDEPGGWRRCALAFLEAQSWKKDLRRVAQEPTGREGDAKPLAATRQVSLLRRLPTWLAVAASFLIALVLGSRLQEAFRPGPAAPRPPIDSIAKSDTADTPLSKPLLPQGIEPKLPETPSEAWKMVTLTGPDGPEGPVGSLRLPAIERDSLDEAWLSRFPAAMPDEVLRALERTGHQVRRHRELVPFEMQDGRRLVVPVDQVEVHYVGNPPL